MLKVKVRSAALIAAACWAASGPAPGENPIIQTSFTADPVPIVHGDTVYLYAGQDEDDAQGFKMLHWRLYASKDMVNWTDHGPVVKLSVFPWARQDNDAWAPHVVERDGKFYFYATVTTKQPQPKRVIGVAVANSPLGPFKDALGRPLIDHSPGDIDPATLIDDDGQAYLYWGNPVLWSVKLNKDMISYSDKITQVESKPNNYQEGPWAYKRNGKYYLAYASTCCPEGMGYAMSDRPTGPWEYQGHIMEPNQLSSGNHPGIIDFKGKTYVFGFNYRLQFNETPLHRERRSITVAELAFRPDGTIPTLPFWDTTGVKQVQPLSPYGRVEAETIAWATRMQRVGWDRPFDWFPGIKTAHDDRTGMYVYPVAARSYVKVAGVDFGTQGPKTFKASVASETAGGKLEVRAGGPYGQLLATVDVPATGGDGAWVAQAVPSASITGQHDLYFVFNGNGKQVPFKVDYWQFER